MPKETAVDLGLYLKFTVKGLESQWPRILLPFIFDQINNCRALKVLK